MRNKQEIARTAPDALRIFWQEGFFRTRRDQPAVVAHLAKKGNNFSSPELGMALKRAKHLTRRGKRGGYEYIQKYPFVADEKGPRVKEKA